MMIFLAFVVFIFNISVIGYLIYSWVNRDKPEKTPKSLTPEEVHKKNLRETRNLFWQTPAFLLGIFFLPIIVGCCIIGFVQIIT
tara:strand:+ start:468 stop:719 length:252 start_codon:yes stop_codon:yes gene_type:complete